MIECFLSQRVHVGIWYILMAQSKRGSQLPTLRPKYIPYTYMDPLGMQFPGSLTNPYLEDPDVRGSAKMPGLGFRV